MATNKTGRAGEDGPRATESMAQATSGETEHKEAAAPEELVKKEGRQYFNGTVAKVDKDGNTVLSDHLDEGETLRRETTDRYAAVKDAKRKADEKKNDDK